MSTFPDADGNKFKVTKRGRQHQPRGCLAETFHRVVLVRNVTNPGTQVLAFPLYQE